MHQDDVAFSRKEQDAFDGMYETIEAVKKGKKPPERDLSVLTEIYTLLKRVLRELTAVHSHANKELTTGYEAFGLCSENANKSLILARELLESVVRRRGVHDNCRKEEKKAGPIQKDQCDILETKLSKVKVDPVPSPDASQVGVRRMLEYIETTIADLEVDREEIKAANTSCFEAYNRDGPLREQDSEYAQKYSEKYYSGTLQVHFKSSKKIPKILRGTPYPI